MAKDDVRAKNDNRKSHQLIFCFAVTIEAITHSSDSKIRNHTPVHQGAGMYLQ